MKTPARPTTLAATLALATLLAAGAPSRARAEGAEQAKAPAATLTIDAAGFRNDRGRAMVAVFSQKAGFPDEDQKALRTASGAIANGKVQILVADLPPGAYAVCVYHDENANQKLDTDWLGRPKEGMGASNDAKGHRGPPKFDDAKFTLEAGGKTIAVTIAYP